MIAAFLETPREISGMALTPHPLFTAERRRLEGIGERIASLRNLLNASPEPEPDAPTGDWFAYLSQVKAIQGNTDNLLAFVTTLMARDYLVRRLTVRPFDVAAKPQGASGLDIDTVTGNGQRIIAEIKSTVPRKGNRLGAAQVQTWRKDFDKLNRESAAYKFFFVSDRAAFDVARELYAEEIPGVTVVLLTTGEEFSCPVPRSSASTSSLPVSEGRLQ
jgi:hypothetical protein